MLTELIRDKVVIVTGAAAGIGAGVARLFAEEGAHVYLTDLDRPGVEKQAAKLKSEGHSAFAFEANARDRDAMAAVVKDATGRFKHIDVLINNAGVYPRQPFLDMTEEQWDAMHDINLKSVFHCTKLVMPHMVHQRSGAVVNISSVTFFTGLQNLTHYIASKGAIIGFTRALAREMGPHNVRVNCITPGAIETEGERKLMPKEESDAFMTQQSLKRRITPLDIARVCFFLSTDLSAAMTGQTLNVDGGWIMY
ncbi:MAG TPA: SDR family NAD(P)-dependent oxidoreductase [Acidobacteriaceae bacterium]|nr:SDR family NAD(P)-dependent oxidoreductase [Acidobacteriaceae bacterium]